MVFHAHVFVPGFFVQSWSLSPDTELEVYRIVPAFAEEQASLVVPTTVPLWLVIGNHWLLVPAQAGLQVGEYAPNRVKKTVVGVGHADKAQVMHMVKLQLPGCEPAGPDAADALAIAICHAYFGGASRPALREVCT